MILWSLLSNTVFPSLLGAASPQTAGADTIPADPADPWAPTVVFRRQEASDLQMARFATLEPSLKKLKVESQRYQAIFQEDYFCPRFMTELLHVGGCGLGSWLYLDNIQFLPTNSSYSRTYRIGPKFGGSSFVEFPAAIKRNTAGTIEQVYFGLRTLQVGRVTLDQHEDMLISYDATGRLVDAWQHFEGGGGDKPWDALYVPVWVDNKVAEFLRYERVLGSSPTPSPWALDPVEAPFEMESAPP